MGRGLEYEFQSFAEYLSLANWYGVKVQRNVTHCYTEAKQQFASHNLNCPVCAVDKKHPYCHSRSFSDLAVIPSKTTGGKALNALLSEQKIDRIGKGIKDDEFRYFLRAEG